MLYYQPVGGLRHQHSYREGKCAIECCTLLHAYQFIVVQGNPDAPWEASPTPGECLERARAAARQLLAARQDSLAMWAAYAALEHQAGGIKVGCTPCMYLLCCGPIPELLQHCDTCHSAHP